LTAPHARVATVDGSLSADKGWTSQWKKQKEYLREHPFDQNTWMVPKNQLMWKEYNLDNYTEFLRVCSL